MTHKDYKIMIGWPRDKQRRTHPFCYGPSSVPYRIKDSGRYLGKVGFVLSLLAIVCSQGCGGRADGRNSLSGSVTLDGEPLKEGSISFLSVGAAKRSMTGGAIVDGEYAIPAKEGLVVGTYRVSISAADKSDATAEGLPANGQYFPSLIPPEFEKANHQVEVTDEGPNEFVFEIKNS